MLIKKKQFSNPLRISSRLKQETKALLRAILSLNKNDCLIIEKTDNLKIRNTINNLKSSNKIPKNIATMSEGSKTIIYIK